MSKQWLGCFFFLLSTQLQAADVIKEKVDKLINLTDKHINLGIEVKDLATGKTLYKKNNQRYFVPASNLKLYSTAASLMTFGPHYRFKTQLETNASMIQGSKLNGDLYLSLANSPDLTFSQLKQAFTKLKKNYAIDTIEGNLLVKSNFKMLAPYGPGWMVEDLRYGFGAPVAPVIIDSNSISLTVSPGERIGSLAQLTIKDNSKSIGLINQVKTIADGKYCPINYQMDKQNQLTVKGCVNISSVSRDKSVAVKNPWLYLQGVIQHILQQENIKLTGQYAFSEKSDMQNVTLVQTSSKPIRSLIYHTLKDSDNLYAESLFLNMGAKYFNQLPSWNLSSRALKQLLNKYLSLNLKQATIVDGSGLSRYDLVTPNQTVKLLQAMHSQFPLSYEYMQALPLSGRDGTLYKRMLEDGKADFIRAKTGTMQGVVSLAGLLPSNNGHPLAFAMMINGISGHNYAALYPYLQLEEKIAQVFLKLNLPTPIFNIRKTTKKAMTSPYQHGLNVMRTKKEQLRLNHRLEYALRKQFSHQVMYMNVKHPYIYLNTKYSLSSFKQLKTLLRKYQATGLAKVGEARYFINQSTSLPAKVAGHTVEYQFWL